MNEKKKPVGIYEGEPIHLDGYVPSSWDFHHSSLLRGAAWIGMGLILSSMAGFGAAIWDSPPTDTVVGCRPRSTGTSSVSSA